MIHNQIILEAKRIIAEAERDLGQLTSGQKRDLLMDNTPWDSNFIARVVAQIEQE